MIHKLSVPPSVSRLLTVFGLFAALLLSSISPANAQWTATGVGPYQYDTTGNWNGGVINDTFTNNFGITVGTPQQIRFNTNQCPSNRRRERSSG